MARLRTIGTGSTGSAIGAVVSRGGNTVELFSQGHAARPISGEVVLAVPYGACSWRSSCPGRSWRSWPGRR
jgi:8-hydroxy-5-deazaflavin:NADPH oxidoreductase